MRDERDNSEITEKTRVPIAIAIACVVSCSAGVLWVSNALNRIDSRLIMIEAMTRDYMPARDFKMWAFQLRMDNPTLKVPETSSK